MSAHITRFGIPKSGSYTEIADFIQKNGLQAARKEYAYCLLPESEIGPDGITDGGASIMWNILTGANSIVFNGTNTRVGISTDTTGFDGSQSNLNPSGSATFYLQIVDAGFPTVSGTQITFQVTINGSTANFTWNSFGVDNDGQDGSGTNISHYSSNIGLLNRYVTYQGTKPLGQTWTLQLIIEQS